MQAPRRPSGHSQTAIETYSTDNDGAYTGAAVGAATDNLNQIEPTLNDVGTRATVNSATGNSYEVQVVSTVSGGAQEFRITRSATGAIDYTCDVDGEGGCPSTGVWD